MKKLESGRTMVEMMAVLMIIIVLSLVGLVGYKSAKNYWRATEVVSSAQDLIAIARTKGTYVQASQLNFALPAGVIDMEGYVGGNPFNLSTTTHDYLNDITRNKDTPLCGRATVSRSQDRIRVWYKKGIFTEDMFKAMNSLYGSRCLGTFTGKTPTETDFYFFYIIMPEKDIDE